jgi:hypothetical protein
MHPLTIDILDEALSRQKFSKMVQRYGFERVAVRLVEVPNSSPIYRITVFIGPKVEEPCS